MGDRDHLRLIKSDEFVEDDDGAPDSPATDDTKIFEAKIVDSRKCVLIAEPDVPLAKTLANAFTRAGFRAITAHSGERAISIVREGLVDVLAVELRIPDMRGDVLFELASSHQPHLRYATLFMSGDSSDAAERLIAACNCEVIRKPFELSEVVSAVGKLVP